MKYTQQNNKSAGAFAGANRFNPFTDDRSTGALKPPKARLLVAQLRRNRHKPTAVTKASENPHRTFTSLPHLVPQDARAGEDFGGDRCQWALRRSPRQRVNGGSMPGEAICR